MRIAAIQSPMICDDAAGSISFVVEWLGWAQRRSVDLLLFPEAFLLGHSYDPETITRRARAATDRTLADLCERTAGFPATVIVGPFDVCDTRIFNSAFVIENGRVAGRYAKAYPNKPLVTPGNASPVFVRSTVRYGINICNDANYADAAGRLAEQGASLILYPLCNMLPQDTAARWREKSVANLIARARQTRCWIASSDVTGAADKMVSHGCTAIVAPDGQIVSRVTEGLIGAAVWDLPARP